MDVQQLKQAQEQQKTLEREVLEDIQAKAELLGYTLTKNGDAPAPKQKRKRRTKAELEAANGVVG